MGIVAAILVFCLLIFSHELGHFIVAKACGVYVEDFSLGMGPKLIKWQGKETMYCLRLLPIGGWCKMVGEDEESDDDRAFCRKKVWQRMAIVAAGPIMNFVVAIVIFISIFMMIGTYSTENIVGDLLPDTPASQVLQPGDRIVEIDGIAISSWNDIGPAVAAQEQGADFPVVVIRDGQTVHLTLSSYFSDDHQAWQIGITPQHKKQNIFTAAKLGIEQSVYFTKSLIMAIVDMITGNTAVELSGPVGIVTFISDTASSGIRSLLLITGYLCINLGVINLLPLPALDGSRLVFLAIEGLRGKPIDQNKEGMVHFIGLALLIALMLLVTYQDILRLIQG